MKKAREAEARCRTLIKKHGIIPECVRAGQVMCVQAVALYGSESWWDLKEECRLDYLPLLVNQHTGSILGGLPSSPLGALMRESGLTPTPGVIHSRQQ